MSAIHQKGSTPVFLARIASTELSSGESFVILDPDEISTAKYSIYKRNTAYGDEPYTAISGHVDADIPATAFLETLQTDRLWTADAYGYNFKFSPDTTSGNNPFAQSGVYEIRFTVTRTTGNAIAWHRTLTFV